MLVMPQKPTYSSQELTQIQFILQRENSPSWLLEPPESLIPELHVNLALAATQPDLILRIYWFEELQSALMQTAELPPPANPETWLLDCVLPLPLSIDQSKQNELLQLATWLSDEMPLGVYSVDKETGLNYRYTFLLGDRQEARFKIPPYLHSLKGTLQRHLKLFHKLMSPQNEADTQDSDP